MPAAPQPIQASHDVSQFDCGEPSLNEWLKRRALGNEARGASRTFVLCEADRVIGYYCLAAGAALHADAPGRIRRNMPEPIPVMVLGRLAVDRNWQNRGLGSDLLRDAILRTVEAAKIAGIRALLVHALDARAATFYRNAGFLESPINPLIQLLPLETARQAAAGSRTA